MTDRFDRSRFLFELPEDRIAQTPAEQRDQSKLLVAQAESALQHRTFSDLPDYLREGDVLVLNQTKVMNARCFGYKENGTRIEVFVLSLQCDPNHVPVLVRPAKRIKQDMTLHFPGANVSAKVAAKGDQGRATLAFGGFEDLLEVLDKDGQLPLPPYIKREHGPSDVDGARYQTVFAKSLGAVAAPTAGLHFSQPLLETLAAKGVTVARVTHHVGLGTFKPMVVDDVRDHEMDVEHYEIDEPTATALNLAKREGRRILAVGTTSTRCLESNFDGTFHAGKNQTGLFIYPGYRFRAIDGLVTNFHLPGSTLILLVAALMGTEKILDIYKTAIAMEYRFYSYGDAMLLIPGDL